MTIENQALYDALRNVSSAVDRIEFQREELARAQERLAEKLEDAKQVIETLSPEQVEELAQMPIEAGDAWIFIDVDACDGRVLINAEAKAQARQLYDIKPQETEAQAQARADRILANHQARKEANHG